MVHDTVVHAVSQSFLMLFPKMEEEQVVVVCLLDFKWIWVPLRLENKEGLAPLFKTVVTQSGLAPPRPSAAPPPSPPTDFHTRLILSPY